MRAAVNIGGLTVRLTTVVAAGACLLSLVLVPDLARADNCGSLLSSINQLKAQIPREPRDAAESDRQVLEDYVGLYNRACTGAGRPGGGGGAPYRGGGNNAANALGAAANALGALGDLLDEMDRENQEEAARQQQQQYEQEQEEIQEEIADAQRAAAQRAAAAQARAAQAAQDARQRRALANPFGSSSGAAVNTNNPFDTPKSKGGNPFATTAFAAPPPAATKAAPKTTSNSGASKSGGANQSGFKSDAQIKSDCAKSGSPSVCEATEKSARANSPAYQKYEADQKAAMQKKVDTKQQEVKAAFADYDRVQAQRKPPETVGSLPAILAGLPIANDDGLECGPAGHGRRHNGACYLPWNQSPDACNAQTGGNFVPGDDDHPTAFCAYNAPPNPETAYPGPNEGAQCGDVAGHMHGGACWALGITRDECANDLKGYTMDSGGFQYCVYDAAQLDAERAAAAKRVKLKKKPRKPGTADDDSATPSTPPTPPKPPVQPAAAKQDDAPPAAKPKPDYVCRLADGTVLHTDDPTLMSGYAIDHPPDCHLTNGKAMLGLSGDGDFSDLKIDKNH